MAKSSPLNRVPILQVFYLNTLYHIQQKSKNAVSADLLPYTVQIKWITAQMLKKFPNSRWTEKLVFRTLIRVRKASINKSEIDKLEQPEFPEDNDFTESGPEPTFQIEVEPETQPKVDDDQ